MVLLIYSHSMKLDKKKILLIDEKKAHQHGCGSLFYDKINDDLKSLIEFVGSISDKIVILNEEEANPTFDENFYGLVLLHASYNSPLLNNYQLLDLKTKIKSLITFSGESVIRLKENITSREQLFHTLERALEAYNLTGFFPKKLLFDNNNNRFYPLLDIMLDILEDEGKEALLDSSEFAEYVNILKLDLQKVRGNFLANKSEYELNEIINDWKHNFKI